MDGRNVLNADGFGGGSAAPVGFVSESDELEAHGFATQTGTDVAGLGAAAIVGPMTAVEHCLLGHKIMFSGAFERSVLSNRIR
jgi:hypothetical protein